MGSYSAAIAKHATLVAATVDTVTLNVDATTGRADPAIVVENRGTTDALYFTYSVNGTAPAAPTVAGDDCYYVGPGTSISIDTMWGSDVIVKLISAGTPAYSVEAF